MQNELSKEKIESYIKKLLGLLEIVIPDEIALLKANELQTNELLDPFDSILLVTAISIKPFSLVSRDKSFTKIASKYKEITGKSLDPEKMHKKLKESEQANIIREKIINVDDEPYIGWKTNI